MPSDDRGKSATNRGREWKQDNTERRETKQSRRTEVEARDDEPVTRPFPVIICFKTSFIISTHGRRI